MCHRASVSAAAAAAAVSEAEQAIARASREAVDSEEQKAAVEA